MVIRPRGRPRAGRSRRTPRRGCCCSACPARSRGTRSASRWSSAVRTRSRGVHGPPGGRQSRHAQVSRGDGEGAAVLHREADVEAVARCGVARLRAFQRATALVQDEAPLDEHRLAAAHTEPRGILALARLGADGGLAPRGHDAGADEGLMERARLEVGRQEHGGAAGCEHGGLHRHRLAVGEAHAAELHDLLARRDAQVPRAPAPSVGAAVRRMMREVGTRPWRRISCEKVIRKLARRWVGGSATNVPRPGSRRTRPFSASRAMAWRAVMRLTPNSAHRSASEGSRWPGRSVRDARAQRRLDLAVARREGGRGHDRAAVPDRPLRPRQPVAAGAARPPRAPHRAPPRRWRPPRCPARPARRRRARPVW